MAYDSKQISAGLMVVLGLLLAVFMGVFVTTNPQGGIAALIPLITVSLSLLAFVKPNLGLFALIPVVIWVDEFKRLAVYYGGTYSITVMQALAMPFVILAALNAGFFLQALFGRVKIDRIGWMVFILAGVSGCGIFLTMDAELPTKAQRAANIAGYITLIPIAYTYLRSFDAWRRFFVVQTLFALPAAAWAIKQYHFGFDQIEMTYAMSGLSRVHMSQMLMHNPRVFGFFGSASALGCASIYCAFAYWHSFRYRRRRIAWMFVALLLTYVLVVSTQRTALVYPLIAILASFAFRTKPRVLACYAVASVLFVSGVLSAKYLLEEGLDKINDAIAVQSGWGAEVLRVSTFSDRLRGWERLGRAKSWSLFGTGEQEVSTAVNTVDVNSADYNHDIINKILIEYGAVGLLVVVLFGGTLLVSLHSIPFNSFTKQERNDAAFALALALPMVGMSFVGGDNFNTNPINLQIWTSFSGVLVCRSVIMLRRKERRMLSMQPAATEPPPEPQPGQARGHKPQTT